MNSIMKRILTFLILLSCCFALSNQQAEAGNPDRAGSAGAGHLLINPWAMSSGLNGANSAGVKGIEAMRLNVAGLAFTPKTQVNFANTQWLAGSGVGINALGFAQKLGDSNVLGISMMSVGFGDIEVTTTDTPDGGTGATFRPNLLNIGVGYARSFSNSIHVGFLFRFVSESIADVSASGAAIDMGIQYVTGPRDNFKFGISLRNIGTPMRYSGDGLAVQLISPQGYNTTVNQRSDKYELPSLLNIGLMYDIHAGEQHIISLMGNFTSNSFQRDYIGGGVEYSFDRYFSLRAGYRYEQGLTGDLGFNDRATAYSGLTAGASIGVPFKKDGPGISISYAFRHTHIWNGSHTIGLLLDL